MHNEELKLTAGEAGVGARGAVQKKQTNGARRGRSLAPRRYHAVELMGGKQLSCRDPVTEVVL